MCVSTDEYEQFELLRRWPKSTRCAIYDKTKCIQVISYLTFVTSSALHRIKMAFLSRFLHLLHCHFLLSSSASNLLYNPFGAIVSNNQHNTNSNGMDNLNAWTKESPVQLNASKTIDGIKIDKIIAILSGLNGKVLQRHGSFELERFLHSKRVSQVFFLSSRYRWFEGT